MWSEGSSDKMMLSVATKASKNVTSMKGLEHTCNSSRQSDVNGSELLKHRVGSPFVLASDKVFFQIADYDRTPAQKLELSEAIAAFFGFQYIPDNRRCLLL